MKLSTFRKGDKVRYHDLEGEIVQIGGASHLVILYDPFTESHARRWIPEGLLKHSENVIGKHLVQDFNKLKKWCISYLQQF